MIRGVNVASLRCIVLFLALYFARSICSAQDLAPRAYLITPLHSNALTLTYSFYDGSVLFDGTVPITGASARVSVSVFSAYHSFNFFGRTASFLVSLPYGVGNFHGTVVGAEASAYRSGLLPATFRLSVNLKGGPSMNVEDFSRWGQKTILGASLKLVPATGQYDPSKLINYGVNRWAFKPELGYSRRWGHWILDAYGGGWFFTINPESFRTIHSFPASTPNRKAPSAPSSGTSATTSSHGSGFAGCQLLVRRENRPEWREKSEHGTEEFSHWIDHFDSIEQASFSKAQL